ncbi:MAG: hypothetical protein ACREKE_06715 [bacterium]
MANPVNGGRNLGYEPSSAAGFVPADVELKNHSNQQAETKEPNPAPQGRLGHPTALRPCGYGHPDELHFHHSLNFWIIFQNHKFSQA